MKKQILLSMLVCSLLLSGCGGTAAETETAADVAVNTETETAAETEAKYPLAVETADYGGEEFRTLCYTQGDPGTMKQLLDFAWTDDQKGEVLNDAVYARNLKVEEDFNIAIFWEESDDVKGTTKNAVVAGETVYDIVQPYVNDAMVMGQSNEVWDMAPLMDLNAPWWDAALQRDLMLGGKLYCLTGDVTLGDEELNYGIFYNKALVEQYGLADLPGLDDPYTMVKEGKWTIDAMYTFAQGATSDINGDGTMDINDAYGIGSDYGLACVVFYGTGGQLARISGDGSPEIVLNNERNEAVIERLATVYCDTNASIMVTNMGSDGWTKLNNMLMENRLLFRLGSIYDLKDFREMIDDFGILPNPKYDEAQADYCHIISTNWCPCIAVPVTITGDALERTTVLLEALSCYSDQVMEAYYDVNLSTKLVRDEESADMFDIIFETKYYDLGKVFNWGGIEGIIGTVVKAGGGFASTYARSESKIIEAMEKTWALYGG
ncbi:MAG: hypothetical protein E7631_12345 [Ruminococcaceae bacterium]|nr:hypothetical protein [Oscillospiraceae bacterium]